MTRDDAIDSGLLGRLSRSWRRDSNLGLKGRLRKAGRVILELANARVSLRHCNQVGSSPRVLGRVRIENYGSIILGNGVGIRSPFTPAELVTGPNGSIQIGDHVWINFGTVIAARLRITIGSNSQIGQHCIISDIDIPETAVDPGDARPIHIGNGVWLAGRVTVRPGVTIGDGSVIISGSIVENDIPAGVIAGGIPARVLRSLDGGLREVTPDPVVLLPAPAAIESKAPFSGTLISDFTIDELVAELRRADTLPAAAATVAPFNRVTQTLFEAIAAEPGAMGDFAVVWTRAEVSVPAFAALLRFESVSQEDLLAGVDTYTDLLIRAASRFKAVFVPTWLGAPWRRGLGVIDARPGGAVHALSAMNLRLMDNLSAHSNVFVLDADRWIQSTDRGHLSPKAWYLGKMVLSRAVMTEAALDIRAGLATLLDGPRKLLVLDLDDTLWGGVVGDVGWENIQLGTVDPVGEAFVEFQLALRDLKRRGVVLALVSKNEESVALEAIRRHPEMVLQAEDFVARRINWDDKARNIAEIAGELNLGLQSVVFIDDNPVERSRVREALPQVLVPEWPVERFQYRSALESLRCFDSAARTQEDSDRTRLYREEQARTRAKTDVGSVEEWLKGLEMRVCVELLNAGSLTRATQLLNKTNQLNLSTRRLNEVELLAWSREPGRASWTVTVSDRLGDAGLTGVLSVEQDGEQLRIVDYVLSCRVMGRRVEETMLYVAIRAAVEAGAKSVVANYIETAKNKPCLSFWRASGLTSHADQRFTWNVAEPYAMPDAISLHWATPQLPWWS